MKKLAVVLFISVVLITVSGCSKEESRGLAPGALAPQLELVDFDGKPVTLESFKGKVILVNFWASWCGPCISEMPALEKLHHTLKDKGFAVVGVGIDDQLPALKEFQRKYGLTFPMLFDKNDKAGFRYALNGVPETYVIDREGRIVMFPDPNNGMPTIKISGPRHWASPKAVAILSKLLKQKSSG